MLRDLGVRVQGFGFMSFRGQSLGLWIRGSKDLCAGLGCKYPSPAQTFQYPVIKECTVDLISYNQHNPTEGIYNPNYNTTDEGP